MNRRSFLKALAGASLVAAAPEILVPERRVFALDRTMILPPDPMSSFITGTNPMYHYEYLGQTKNMPMPTLDISEFMRLMEPLLSEERLTTIIMSESTRSHIWGILQER